MLNCKSVLNEKAIARTDFNLISSQENNRYEEQTLFTALGNYFRLSSLLPEGETLGLQFRTYENNICRLTVFKDKNSKATDEDIEWVFRKYEKTQENNDSVFLNLFEDDRRVYALSAKESEYGNYLNSCKGEAYLTKKYCFDKDLIDILKILQQNEAIIRIFTGRKGKSGFPDAALLISIKGALPLRAQAMLKEYFNCAQFTELNKSDECPELPAKLFSFGIAEILSTLCSNADAAVHIFDDDTDDDGIDDILDDISDDVAHDSSSDKKRVTNMTPIEDLDLSVRAYNCLKRAGISYVGEIRRMDDFQLRHIRNLGLKSYMEIKEKIGDEVKPENERTEKAPIADYAKQLEELIGLENAKKEVARITAFARLKKEMKDSGKGDVPMTLNMEFVGNPGTAKTTVARILAGIFYSVGLLESEKIVEVGRADLVGKYVGHTADMIKSVFERARGRLLFIDEAYSLSENARDSFGAEAINTIVQEMENHRDETIVIFAGYPDKMDEFFSVNPGLVSRVPFRVVFNDYNADEMAQIVKYQAKHHGFSIRANTLKNVSLLCIEEAKSGRSGNGRFCRNLVEGAILNFAQRTDSESGKRRVDKRILISADFAKPSGSTPQKAANRIGFLA